MPDLNACIRKHLAAFDFESLFIECLGWDYPSSEIPLDVEIDAETYSLEPVAQKRDFQVFVCTHGQEGELPRYALRKRIERRVAKTAYEHLIVYVDEDRTTQVWQWARQEPGRPVAYREQKYDHTQQGYALAQRIEGLAFSLEEEDRLNIVDISGRVRATFNVEPLTKRFYNIFQNEHGAFLDFIDGISERGDQEWYASIMLNRLMFVYFIQKKRFLDDDPDYLRKRLERTQERQGEDSFLGFYRQFLLRLFHEGLAKEPKHRTSEVYDLLGDIPYLNGGLFEVHELEREYPDIHIPDRAFEDIFDFFDGYSWHLDERPLRDDHEINPDVLGYIFEKYINQKQMGAYYTKEDVTGYISENTIIPYLFDAVEEECAIAYHPDSAMWNLLTEDPNRYIYAAVKKGVIEDGEYVPLPDGIQAGVSDVSKRGVWNRPADDRYALPTETWREHIARRERCADLRLKLGSGDVTSIDDFVTLNLDIRQFAQDAIENCEGPELLRAFYKAIQNVSILDPTCGSGAFLFAALNILEPLYEACLERMERFVEEDGSGQKYADFREILDDVGNHPNRRYFVLKAIMVRNLYGVDIMEEAVEIARLRLFLKLMAQLESKDQIEPLPDIDFNLRAGNTLVGFASMKELRKTLEKKLDIDNKAEKIEEDAKAADAAFQRFHRMQMENSGTTDSEEFAEAKAELRERLGGLNADLDQYLAVGYGTDLDDEEAFVAWQGSHQPFHWLVEFFRIMQSGGFSVIVGNPPYIEISRSKLHYSVNGYRSKDSGNLYCPMMEKGIALSRNTSGRFGMIVPMSIASTERMTSARKVLEDDCGKLWLSHFSGDANPSKLFEGVKFRLSIVLASMSERKSTWSSAYSKWFAAERQVLFQTLQYQRVEDSHRYLGLIPKLGSSVVSSVMNKLTQLKPLAQSLGSSSDPIYVHRVLTMYVKCFDFVPYFWNEAEGIKKSEDYKPYLLRSTNDADCATAMVNSSTFFLYFILLGDGFHCGKEFVHSFPASLERLSTGTRDSLLDKKRLLMDSMNKHSIRRVAQSKKTGRVEYDEFWPRHSKTILDEIDRILAGHYGFTDEELDFIINYDIKYRMGAEAAG